MNARQLANLKARLLAAPVAINVRAAALRVFSHRHKCSPEMAKWKLEELQSTSHVNALFGRVMPEEYKKVEGWSRIRRARHFYTALGFPINEDGLEQEFYNSIQEGYNIDEMDVPIYSSQPENWENYEYETIDLSYKVALLLTRPEGANWTVSGDDYHWEHLATKYTLPKSLKPNGNVKLKYLFEMCEARRDPLKFLPLAMRITDYNSNCVFFDFNYEWGELDLPWTRENVSWLQEQYQIALRIERDVERLNRWLLAAPAARIAQACRLYRKAQKITNDEESKVSQRVSVHPGRPLVDVF